jgi:hypothetical protein
MLVNAGTASANATLNFFADDGSRLSLPLSFPQTGAMLTEILVNQEIPAGGMLVIVTQGQNSGAVVTGSAQLSTTGNVSGLAIFQNAGQEAVVPLEVGSANSYILPFDNTEQRGLRWRTVQPSRPLCRRRCATTRETINLGGQRAQFADADHLVPGRCGHSRHAGVRYALRRTDRRARHPRHAGRSLHDNSGDDKVEPSRFRAWLPDAKPAT